jgi:hypothetical protein
MHGGFGGGGFGGGDFGGSGGGAGVSSRGGWSRLELSVLGHTSGASRLKGD